MGSFATTFEADLPHCVRNVKEKNVLPFKFRCNIFIGVRIIKEMPGSISSGTSCTSRRSLSYNVGILGSDIQMCITDVCLVFLSS
jgi:hypothetical protein